MTEWCFITRIDRRQFLNDQMEGNLEFKRKKENSFIQIIEKPRTTQLLLTFFCKKISI